MPLATLASVEVTMCKTQRAQLSTSNIRCPTHRIRKQTKGDDDSSNIFIIPSYQCSDSLPCKALSAHFHHIHIMPLLPSCDVVA